MLAWRASPAAGVRIDLGSAGKFMTGRWLRAAVSTSSAAIAAGDQAVSYKVLFVGIWNPIAVQYGLPQTPKGNI
jgi:hypothetical protein